MTQSRSADAVPSGTVATQRTTGPALALRNWRVARQLIVLVAIPAVLILALTGLRVTDAARSAETYGQVGRLAALGQQVAGLAQAMTDERSGTAVFISGGRPTAGLPALHRQYAITDGRAASVRRLVSQLGHGYPAQTRAGAAQAPGQHRQAAWPAQTGGAEPDFRTGRDNRLLRGDIWPVPDQRQRRRPERQLHAHHQRAGARLAVQDDRPCLAAAGHPRRGAYRGPLRAGSAHRADHSRKPSKPATSPRSATRRPRRRARALTETLASPLARQAQAVEQRATTAGNGVLALGPRASKQWSAGMSYTVGWMGHADQQLAGWITADAQALQRSAMRSAIITGGAGLGALALVLLGTVFAARSMVRRLRRLEAAAREGAGARSHQRQRCIHRLLLAQPFAAGTAAPADRQHGTQRGRPGTAGQPVRDGPSGHPDLAQLGQRAPPRRPRARRARPGRSPWWTCFGPQRPRSRSTTGSFWTSSKVSVSAGSLRPTPCTCSPNCWRTPPRFLLSRPGSSCPGTQLVGGGSLITITDGGTGMSEEELTLLNWQLDNPASADMAVARRHGLVRRRAHGGTARHHGDAEQAAGRRYHRRGVPSRRADLTGRQARGLAGTGRRTRLGRGQRGSRRRPAGLPFPASGSPPRPEPPLGPETDEPEAVPLVAERAGAITGRRNRHCRDRTRDRTRAGGRGAGRRAAHLRVRPIRLRPCLRPGPAPFSEQQASQPPTGQPARPPASWGDRSSRAAAGPPAAGSPSQLSPPGPGRQAAQPPPAPRRQAARPPPGYRSAFRSPARFAASG